MWRGLRVERERDNAPNAARAPIFHPHLKPLILGPQVWGGDR